MDTGLNDSSWVISHTRMGDIVNSDYALSKEIYLELIDQFDTDWEDTQSDEKRDTMMEFSHLLNLGYSCGLQGEDIVKLDISGF
jgi:ABC-type sulfate transport system substrate-binding protein